MSFRSLTGGSQITAVILALFGVVISASSAHADLLTFNIAWSGAYYGNSAIATGNVVIDAALLPNPSSEYFGSLASLGIQSLSITVTGASSGNGTFTAADFSIVSWDTGGTALDLGSSLVGQADANGIWGTPDAFNGDFNLYRDSLSFHAPSGIDFFTIGTDATTGSPMLLTQFSPVPGAFTVPESSTIFLLGLTLPLITAVISRRVVISIVSKS